MKIVILGLSITSSWGNGHATTYRGLVRELVRAGHEVLFLERDVPWYAAHRDLPEPPYGSTRLYQDLDDLQQRFEGDVRTADAVIVGSFVPEGVAVGDWVLTTAGGIPAFYDIDTPVTLARLVRGEHDYLAPSQIPRYQLYLSFTGGPTLRRLEQQYGSPCARALYCSFDPELYYPEDAVPQWDLGYLGTYSPDRQPRVDALLLEPARRWPAGRFAVAGAQYPPDIAWSANVAYREHIPPSQHRAFYNAQRFTLNVTRDDMIRAGYAPSVRLFEAAACATPVISDDWPGIETLFSPGEEILLAHRPEEVLVFLTEIPDVARRAMGQQARQRVLARHTAAHRAAELIDYLEETVAGEMLPLQVHGSG
ncbi:MAG TPA: glycosyltransferase [Gammaproteobacteria bacterium]|nr:glycosyltransferase [Gammaproteobacteria bacterium]